LHTITELPLHCHCSIIIALSLPYNIITASSQHYHRIITGAGSPRDWLTKSRKRSKAHADTYEIQEERGLYIALSHPRRTQTPAPEDRRRTKIISNVEKAGGRERNRTTNGPHKAEALRRECEKWEGGGLKETDMLLRLSPLLWRALWGR
jgi:hypothetical protein